jgi:hypothetical protein
VQAGKPRSQSRAEGQQGEHVQLFHQPMSLSGATRTVSSLPTCFDNRVNR